MKEKSRLSCRYLCVNCFFWPIKKWKQMRQMKQYYYNIITLTTGDSGVRTRWIVTWTGTSSLKTWIEEQESSINKNKHLCTASRIFYSILFYYKIDPKTSVIPSFCMSSTILLVVFSSCCQLFLLGFCQIMCDHTKFLAWKLCENITHGPIRTVQRLVLVHQTRGLIFF